LKEVCVLKVAMEVREHAVEIPVPICDIYTGSTHDIYREYVLLCHSPPPFSKIRTRILKKERMMMVHIDENTYNMMQINENT